MLSRNADSLFWMGRFIERADYLARILDAGIRLSALPAPGGDTGNEWESALASAGVNVAFHALHGEAEEGSVRDFLAFDAVNPSSIVSCLTAARTNARAVRTRSPRNSGRRSTTRGLVWRGVGIPRTARGLRASSIG